MAENSSKTVSSETTKPAAKRAASKPAKKGGGLEAGAVASSDVHLRMEGGYGDDYLVPGKPADGQPGVLLVQKGDVVTEGAIKRMERAEANAKRIKG